MHGWLLPQQHGSFLTEIGQRRSHLWFLYQSSPDACDRCHLDFAGPHGRFLSVAELAAAAAEKLATKVPENIATRSSPIVVAEAQPPQKQPSKEAPAMASSTVTPKAESQPKQYHNEAAPSNAFKLPAYRTSTDDMLAGGTLMVAP